MPATERQSADSTRSGGEPLLAALIAGQRRAIERVAAAGVALEGAAKLVAAALGGGGRLVYLGAGSSGLLAMQDGLELPGTFGLDAERIRFVTPEGNDASRSTAPAKTTLTPPFRPSMRCRSDPTTS